MVKMATFIHQGCKNCRHCEGGARNIGMQLLTGIFLTFTCGHSYWLNKH